MGPGIREVVGIFEPTGEEPAPVVLVLLPRAADTTVVRMVLAVADDGLLAVPGWEGTCVSETGATRLDTRSGLPLMNAGFVPPDTFSGAHPSGVLRGGTVFRGS